MRRKLILAALSASIVAALAAVLLLSGGPIPAAEGIPPERDGRPSPKSFADRLAAAALERTRHRVRYDPAYVKLDYPGGDVPEGRGVCTDVVIRSFRKVGIDLQKLVHEDMKGSFSSYPRKWGLKRPDSNIDHRRVPNLATFFRRKGVSVDVTRKPADYRPGDIVTWDLGRGVAHIGIVIGRSRDGTPPLVVHNIGAGPKAEDVLLRWKITGHFRYGSATGSGGQTSR